jgi:hypothetical protein
MVMNIWVVTKNLRDLVAQRKSKEEEEQAEEIKAVLRILKKDLSFPRLLIRIPEISKWYNLYH